MVFIVFCMQFGSLMSVNVLYWELGLYLPNSIISSFVIIIIIIMDFKQS